MRCLSKVLGILATACLPFATSSLHAADKKLCFSASGNGFNWAATMAWMAETINRETEALSENSSIDINCVSGSSSSAAFVGMVSALRQNPRLFARGADNRPLSPDELRVVARGLLFLAFASEMSGKESKPYTNQDGHLDLGLDWWDGHFKRTKILLDFSNRIAMAYHLTREDLHLVDGFFSLNKLYSVDALKETLGDHGDNTNLENHVLLRQLYYSSQKICDRGQQILKNLYASSDRTRFPRPEAYKEFIESADHPVRKALSLPISKGHFTLSVVELAYSNSPQTYLEQNPKAPSFHSLRTLVMGNEASIKKTLQSDSLQKDLDSKHSHFVFGKSEDLLSLVSISLMEPDLNQAKVFNMAPRSSENLDVSHSSGVTKYFDPKIHSITRPKLHHPRTVNHSGVAGRPMLAVMGGWTDGRLSSQVAGFYSEGSNDSDRQFFLKTRQTILTTFAIEKIEDYFSGGTPELAKKDFRNRTLNWRPLKARLIERMPSATFEHTTIEWDLPHYPENRGLLREFFIAIDSLSSIGFMKRPAAIKQQSYLQVVHTINGLRVMRNQVASHGLYFDRALNFEPRVYSAAEL